jgi:hypothetical protein
MKTMELWNLKFSHNCTQLEICPTVSQEKIVRLWRSEKKNAGYDQGNFTSFIPTSSYPGMTGYNTCVVHIPTIFLLNSPPRVTAWGFSTKVDE